MYHREELAFCLMAEDRTGEAVEQLELVATGRERMLGPEHPDTVTARERVARVRAGGEWWG